MAVTLAHPAIVSLDAAIDQLASLAANWDQRGAPQLDRRTLTAARTWLRNLPDRALDPAPAVVPLSSGALQFEWHVAARILELEFESPDVIHYLKWDPPAGREEESTFPAADIAAATALIDWVRNG